MYNIYSICDFLFDRRVEENGNIHEIISSYGLKEDEFNNITGQENLLTLLNKKEYSESLGGTSLVSLKILKGRNEKIPITFVGAVGGEKLHLEDEKIDFILEKIPERRSTVCYILIENNHRTMCTNVEASICLSNKFINNFLCSHKINAHSLFYLCGFLIFHKENKLNIFETFFKNNPHIFLIFNISTFIHDANYAKKFISLSHIIIGNRREFIFLQERLKNEFNISLLKEFNKKIFLITDGENPVTAYFQLKELKISVIHLFSQKYERIDTCGAGDAFSAGIIEKVIFCLENKIDFTMEIETIVKHGIKVANHYIIQNSLSK